VLACFGTGIIHVEPDGSVDRWLRAPAPTLGPHDDLLREELRRLEALGAIGRRRAGP
jgi:hypothetical protein